MRVLFIHEAFLVYKLETFTNCKEVKQMIMTIAIIYIFLSYEIWSTVENYFQKILIPLPPLEKIYPTLFTHFPH